jgi:hypothetical protein
MTLVPSIILTFYWNFKNKYWYFLLKGAKFDRYSYLFNEYIEQTLFFKMINPTLAYEWGFNSKKIII